MNKRVFKVVIALFLIIIVSSLNLLLLKFYGYGIPCMFHFTTGLLCPGCGGSRAVLTLLSGDFRSAFEYNGAVILLLPFLIFYFFVKIKSYILARKVDITNKIPLYILIILLIAIVIFSIYRNVGIIRNYLSYIIN